MSISAKTLGKRLLSLLYSHRQGSLPDIFIFSTQRSGSTLLFDMLASQPGFKAVGEPFQERKQAAMGRYFRQLLSRYVEFGDEKTERGVERYIGDLLSGEFVDGFERTYDPRNPRHHFLSERNAVKILRASYLIPWFRERFPGRYLFLVRHPIPVALSRSRNGWQAPLSAFQAQNRLFSQLSTAQIRLVERASQEPLFRRHLVVWCLEHTGLLPSGENGKESDKFFFPFPPDREVPLVFYEHLLSYGESILPLLAERWRLAEPDRFVKRFTTPSRSSRYSSGEVVSAMRRGDSEELIGRWRERISAEDLEFAARALDIFEISAYRAYDIMPTVRI